MKKAKVIPILIGALGTVPRRLENYIVPEKHKCWHRVDSTSKNSPVRSNENPPKSP